MLGSLPQINSSCFQSFFLPCYSCLFIPLERIQSIIESQRCYSFHCKWQFSCQQCPGQIIDVLATKLTNLETLFTNPLSVDLEKDPHQVLLPEPDTIFNTSTSRDMSEQEHIEKNNFLLQWRSSWQKKRIIQWNLIINFDVQLYV